MSKTISRTRKGPGRESVPKVERKGRKLARAVKRSALGGQIGGR